MAISDLKARQGNVVLLAVVVEKGDVRTFEKFGKPGRVCNAKVKDDSGEVTLTLWNEDIDNVNVGDKIKITNGWVSEYQGELQLSTGKFGKLEIIGKGEEPKKEEKPAPKVDDVEEGGEEIEEDVAEEEFVDGEEE